MKEERNKERKKERKERKKERKEGKKERRKKLPPCFFNFLSVRCSSNDLPLREIYENDH